MTNHPQQNLNLARRLRPQTFDAVIGQDLSISMLKNSLYQKIYFPAYLLTGQRGCGKTTSARIFAAAINCMHLPQFQQNPHETIPCLTCTSCKAMQAGNHPDFIEIDAASNTGVDNVRAIIEAASFVPLLGQKKLYLIDEAHMLSKAAFNAFLKLLEEPPTTALFMLATTELHKIPDTVLSRCIKLSFKALAPETLTEYLIKVCSEEGISIEVDAISCIVNEAEGSARDALTILEQIRYSAPSLTKEKVLSLLGKVNMPTFFTLVGHMIRRQPAELLEHLHHIHFEQQNPQYFWQSLLLILRGLLWTTYNPQACPPLLQQYYDLLIALARECSTQRIHALLQLFWSQEPLLLQTHKKHMLIELIMLQACEQQAIPDPEALKTLLNQYDGVQAEPQQTLPKDTPLAATKPSVQPVPQPQPTPLTSIQEKSLQPDTWHEYLEKLSKANTDHILIAIFKQAYLKEIRQKTLLIALKTNNAFLVDKLQATRGIWLPILKEFFPDCTDVEFTSQPQEITPTIAKPTAPTEQPPPPKAPPAKQPAAPNALSVEGNPDWPLANLLLKHFPGTLKKVETSSS